MTTTEVLASFSHVKPMTPTGCRRTVVETLPEAVQRIVDEIRPDKIILFGSYANGVPTPDSDVDLLVIWDTPLPPLPRYLAVSQLLNPRPFPVDLLVRTSQEIETALAQNDSFVREILTQGKVLYEQ